MRVITKSEILFALKNILSMMSMFCVTFTLIHKLQISLRNIQCCSKIFQILPAANLSTRNIHYW